MAEPINQKVTIPLTASTKLAAEQEAERTGETRSAVLRRWIQLGREASQ